MPRRPTLITVERVNRPDPQAAAEAILPMFLAFLGGRLVKRPTVEGGHVEPARVDETRSRLPP